MKKVLILILCTFAMTTAQAAVDADVTGNLTLKGKRKSSESFLELLKCGLEELPKKFLRKEKVKASYSGASKLTLEQETDNDEKYFVTFRVPSILRVASTKKVKREVVKSGTVGVECVGADEEPDNTGSQNSNFSKSIVKTVKKHRLRNRKLARNKLQRAQNKVANFLRAGGDGLTFSVKSLVAVRKGNKGKLKGTFTRKADKAAGRFVLKFKYKDEE